MRAWVGTLAGDVGPLEMTSGAKHMFSRADAYERFMGRWSRQLAPAFVAFAGVRPADAVLDVGCGTGALSFAARAAASDGRVTGIDASEDFVRHAALHSGDGRVEFLVGDARRLESPDATFDRTLSLLVLNFVPDADAAVREWMRVTKPGGVLAAAVWDYGDGMEMLRAFWDEATALDPSLASSDEAHMPLCRRGELAALWSREGLVEVEEVALTVPLRFASFDDYWQPFLLGQGPAGACVAKLSQDARAELAARLRRRLCGDDPPRAIEMRARAWAVKGSRRSSTPP